jgi:hypothetical protein
MITTRRSKRITKNLTISINRVQITRNTVTTMVLCTYSSHSKQEHKQMTSSKAPHISRTRCLRTKGHNFLNQSFNLSMLQIICELPEWSIEERIFWNRGTVRLAWIDQPVFQPPNPPKIKFGMEISLKMKVVCTWGFDLKVDFDEVMEVTSKGVH